jgi:acetyl-CoA C-acetyltransferase
MSNVPFYLPNHRKGHSFGNVQLLDGLAFDALTDVYNNIAMGLCAEKTVNDLQIDREIQVTYYLFKDEFCINSYEKLISAINSGKISHEIATIEL